MPVGGSEAFSYALLRVVPDLARGECLNAGVVLFCRRRGFLGLRWALDRERLSALGGAGAQALAPALEAELAHRSLVAVGHPTAGPLARLSPSDRFGWLVAPASTMIQPSRVHTGLSSDPEATLASLFTQLVSAS